MEQLGDITKINGAAIPPTEIFTFGSPCQDLSIAGKRSGMAGERSGLFMEAIRIIKEMRNATNEQHPRIAVWENVPGAFSSNGSKDFKAVIEELVRVKEQTAVIPEPTKGKWSTTGCIMGDGYSIAWRVLCASLCLAIHNEANGKLRIMSSHRQKWREANKNYSAGFT